MAIAVGLAGGACSDGGTSTADPTVPTAAPPTSSPAPATPDVSVIPATIDEPYLNAVLAALDEIDGQATRIIKSTKSFSKEAAGLLNAIYSDEWFDVQTEAWLTALAKDPALTAIKANPGNRKSTVERLITVKPDCVWMAATRDRTANSTTPSPPQVEFVALRPLDRSNDPSHRNPTAWMIATDGSNEDGTEPGNPCAAG